MTFTAEELNTDRQWSPITGRGGGYKMGEGGGGQVKCYPYNKELGGGGDGKRCSCTERGRKWFSVLKKGGGGTY